MRDPALLLECEPSHHPQYSRPDHKAEGDEGREPPCGGCQRFPFVRGMSGVFVKFDGGGFGLINKAQVADLPYGFAIRCVSLSANPP